MMDKRVPWVAVKNTAGKLLTYCSANDWAGYDPYDALNSPLLKALPLLDSRLPRLALIQVLKRSPINIRPLLRVPKTQNPKGIALFLAALLRCPELGTGSQASSLKERLVALRSPNSPYWCWGYSFPWQTRTQLVPRGTPNLVCSIFVGNALLDLYERRLDAQCRTMAESTASYILNELYWTNGNDVAGLGYPLPTMRHQIHNANLLGAAFLVRVYGLTGDRNMLEAATKLARYSASRQRDDGSWAYGEGATQQWVDNFHTGYNLCALQQIDRSLRTNEFESQISRGFEFYKSHFFREDGAPRYFHDRTYPIDIHSVAQGIITLLAFRELYPAGVPLALSVFQWAKAHMWDDRGFFYYRALRGCTIRTSYMRWSQAWMLLALATLSNAVEERSGSQTPAPAAATAVARN
jgi:hypothetical protein